MRDLKDHYWMGEQSRSWCITWFIDQDASDEHEAAIIQDVCERMHTLLDEGVITGAVFQLESADTGRHHLQGYVQFARRLRFTPAGTIFIQLFGTGVHHERARGSAQQGADYCRKEESRIPGVASGPHEFGTIVGQGGRTDLDAIRIRIKEGASPVEIAEEFPFGLWCRYRRSFAVYRSLWESPRNWITAVSILWGPTGTGKTRSVWDGRRREDVYNVPCPTVRFGPVWFDGYAAHKTVLFDDFYGWARISTLLQLCDRYACQAGVKGGHVNWRPREIFFTSNTHPDSWYPNVDERVVRSFKRRVTALIYFGLDDERIPGKWE